MSFLLGNVELHEADSVGISSEFKKTCIELGEALGGGCKSITTTINLAVFRAQNFTCIISFILKQPYETGIYFYLYLNETLNL